MSHLLNMYQGVEDLINGVEPAGGAGEEHIADAGEAIVEAVKVEVAEAVAEIEQVAQEVEVLRTEVEKQDEALDELQEEIGGMESMLASGNFSPASFAHSYNKALRLNAKLGGQSFNTLGAESISDAATARISAVTGMEGFMDTVKKGAGKAVEFIKHIFNTVINFFVGMVSTTAALERRQKQLDARLEKADLKDKIKLGAWNVGFDYASGGMKAADQFLASPFSDIMGVSLPAFVELGKSESINASSFKTAYAKLIGDIKGVAKAAAGNATEKGEGDKRSVIGAHAGVRVFVVYEDKYESDDEIVSAARSIKISFGKTEEAKKFSTGESPVKASKAQLKAALKGVGEYVHAIRDSKIQQKFSKAERDRVIATLNLKTKTEGKGKDENGKAIALTRAVYSTGSSLTTSLNNFYVRIAKQLMDAVQAHI